MFNKLSPKRIVSIDALRGITIWVMVFVNTLAGMAVIPDWMKHMPADADGMSFVDVVFPAFLFIAGMSIPFALNNRIARDPNQRHLESYILFRVLGLLCFGFFMVNADTGGAPTMPISIAAWELIFYVCAFLVWQVYRDKSPKTVMLLRALGIAGLVVLAVIFREGKNGTEHMSPKWWGILGMIGWAYLFSTTAYIVSNGRIPGLLAFVALCTVLFALTAHFDWKDGPAKNATHMGIMTCGVILSLIMFDESVPSTLRQRMTRGAVFAALLLAAASIFRLAYPISKIKASPSWGFYCAGICVVLYLLLYWLIDLRGVKAWTGLFRPAAENPLLTYLLPDMIYALTLFFHVKLFPDSWTAGKHAMLICAVYATMIMLIAKGLNRLHIRLQL